MHTIGNSVLPGNPMRSHLAYLVLLLLKKQNQQEPDVQDMAMMTFTVWTDCGHGTLDGMLMLMCCIADTAWRTCNLEVCCRCTTICQAH